MRVDAVIVTYESAATIAPSLETLAPALTAIVVDNASRDDSASLAEAAGADVVRNRENRGFAAAANQGAALGSGELILFLNPDAAIARADLDRLIAAFDDPEVAFAGPRLVHADGSEQRPSWPFPSARGTWAEALGLHRVRPARPPKQFFVVGTCLLARRHAFEELGGFDERFWLYGEEADLCRRAWDQGWRVRLVSDAVARHLGGASGESAPALVFEHFQRGAEHFVAKHEGRRGLVLHRAGLLVGSILRSPLPRRRAMAVRLARVLATQPTRVAR